MLWILLACTPSLPISSELWTAPSFSGDGLPPSEDTAHQAPDTVPTPAHDTGLEDAPPTDMAVHAGAVATFDPDDPYAILILALEPVSCREAFEEGGLDSQGLLLTLVPELLDVSAPRWAGSYDSCDGAGCVAGTWSLAGRWGELSEPQVQIEHWSDREASVSWWTDVSEGTLSVTACGQGEPWSAQPGG
jgi:hypothetical protein